MVALICKLKLHRFKEVAKGKERVCACGKREVWVPSAEYWEAPGDWILAGHENQEGKL